MSTPDLTRRESFPAWSRDIARFADTDCLGHINNAAYATFLETARTDLLLGPEMPVPAGNTFVIVRLTIEFRAEMHWRGAVEIGSVLRALGHRSLTLGHGIFKDASCCATGEAVLVLFDQTTRRSAPLPLVLRDRLTELLQPKGA